MDIYSFINSKDVAAYCRELNHEFSPLEQAIMVYESVQSLDERHKAWQWIVDNLPDMEMPKNNLTLKYSSLHQFLRDFIALENKLLKRAINDEPGDNYTCIDWDFDCDDDKSVDDSTFNGVLEKARERMDLSKTYTLFKRWKGWEGAYPPIDMIVKLNGEIISIRTPHNTIRTPNIPEYELLHVFDENDMQIYLPIPFKKGDIVSSASNHPYNTEVWKGDSVISVQSNLEYFHGELPRERRSLLPLSNYLKENISLDLFMNSSEVILLEDYIARKKFHISDIYNELTRFAAPPLPTGNFTDIYSYIPSRDISEHCREIKHEFNSLEQAFIVYLSNKTLAEKHKAWQNIIDTLPDMEVPENYDCPKYDSLHQLLRDYMALENRIIKMFESDEPNVAYNCDDTDYSGHDELFATWKSMLDSIMEDYEGCVFEFFVHKRWIGGENKRLTVKVGTYGEIIALNSSWYEFFDYKSKEHILGKYFDCIQINIPTPFKEGDILIDKSPLKNEYKISTDFDDCPSFRFEPFVFHSDADKEVCFTIGDIREDMYIHGYSLGYYGDLYSINKTYQTLEYYRDELTGYRRILKAISRHIKGEICVDELMNVYDVILHEEKVTNLWNCIGFKGNAIMQLAGFGEKAKVVGLFWYIPDEDRLIVEKYPIDETDLDSNHVTAKSAWEKYKDEYKCDYKHYPCGRLNYLPKSCRYELEMEACFSDNLETCFSNNLKACFSDNLIARIKREFGIGGKAMSYVIWELSNQSTANGRCKRRYTFWECGGGIY